jgi:hypothetical protein
MEDFLAGLLQEQLEDDFAASIWDRPPLNRIYQIQTETLPNKVMLKHAASSLERSQIALSSRLHWDNAGAIVDRNPRMSPVPLPVAIFDKPS